MKPTPEGDLIPAVAEKYEISDDQLTYTFTIRDGIKFHNGDPVTAEDVGESLARCKNGGDGIFEVEAFPPGCWSGGRTGPPPRSGGS